MVGAWNWGTSDAPEAAPAGPDCGKCPVLSRETREFNDEALRTDQLLARQQQELDKLGPNETSIRMKMTSAMFVLAAKRETAQNRAKIRHGQWELNCGACSEAGVKKRKRGQ